MHAPETKAGDFNEYKVIQKVFEAIYQCLLPINGKLGILSGL